MDEEKPRSVDDRINEWVSKGKIPNEITWGMLCDGYRSIVGIPDDFYSAEDPADRVTLWDGNQGMEYRRWNKNYPHEKSENDDSLYKD
ncbi:hypothetical protein J4471_05460 [Candidatus Woesearchaeota archaeon]|nr:hypothetical protein [Candidatus Woesearchaeota archaeon]